MNKEKMSTLKMIDDKNITNHIHSFKLLLEEWATFGLIYNEEEKVEILLASLPKFYKTKVQSLTNIARLTVKDCLAPKRKRYSCRLEHVLSSFHQCSKTMF